MQQRPVQIDSQSECSEIEFHERFHTNPYAHHPIKRFVRILTSVVATILSSTFSFVVRGSRNKDWTFSYQVGLDCIRAFIVAAEQEPPDFQRGQKWAIDVKPKIEKGLVVEELYIKPDPDVVAFLKSKVSAWHKCADQLDQNLLCEWIKPEDSHDDERVILHFHGGGYTFLSSKTHRQIISRVALKSGIKVFTVNYRLAPQNPFPCAVIDALSAYFYLVKACGYHHSKIAIMGDSAAGGLSLALTLALRDWSMPLPACLYLQSPWVDLSHKVGPGSLESNRLSDYVKEQPVDPRRGSNEERLHYYAPNDMLQEPYVSPYFASLDGLPPMLLQVGGKERLYDEIVLFAKKAAAANTTCIVLEEYSGYMHVFQMFPQIAPAALIALDRAAEYLAARLSPTTAPHPATSLASASLASASPESKIFHLDFTGTLKSVTDL